MNETKATMQQQAQDTKGNRTYFIRYCGLDVYYVFFRLNGPISASRSIWERQASK